MADLIRSVDERPVESALTKITQVEVVTLESLIQNAKDLELAMQKIYFEEQNHQDHQAIKRVLFVFTNQTMHSFFELMPNKNDGVDFEVCATKLINVRRHIMSYSDNIRYTELHTELKVFCNKLQCMSAALREGNLEAFYEQTVFIQEEP